MRIADFRYKFEQEGVTPLISVMSSTDLEQLQQLIYDTTQHLIAEHDEQLALEDKLSLPFDKTPSHDDWTHLMQTINSSEQMNNIINSPHVLNVFKQIFDGEPEQYPISYFRAQFPGMPHSTFDWHQDMGTWYVVSEESQGLAEKIAVTMWFSVGHADEGNSIEIAKYTHRLPLLKHNQIEKQGFFQAEIDDVLDPQNFVRIRSNPGDGILMHPLTLHRSIESTNNAPRYSIDIRYYDPNIEAEYDVNPEFENQRKKFIIEN